MEKRLKEIFDKKIEIRSKLETDKDFNADEILAELKSLEQEEIELRSKQETAQKINDNKIETKNIEKPKVEEKRTMENNKFGTVEYRSAFMAHVTQGAAIPAEYRSTLTTDVGAVIPTTIMDKVHDKMFAHGMILPLVTRTAFTSGLSVPVGSLKPVATWVAEGATSEKQKKAITSVVFAHYKLRCAVSVSLEVATMSLQAFEQALVENIAEAMTVSLEQAIINGTGVGQPKGILTETGIVVDAAKIDYKTLAKADSELAIEHENAASWVMSKKTFMEFVAMTDTAGQPIARVNYGLQSGVERMLFGRPVVLCNYLDSFATAEVGKPVAFLFNFKDYVLNTNLNIGLKKYEDNETDDIVTKAIMIADGKVVDASSLVILKKA